MASDNKKDKRSAVLCNWSPPADQHQNPDWMRFWVTSPSLYTGHEFYSVEYPFGDFQPPVPDKMPPSLFCVPPQC